MGQSEELGSSFLFISHCFLERGQGKLTSDAGVLYQIILVDRNLEFWENSKWM